jgi:hypothetical protein
MTGLDTLRDRIKDATPARRGRRRAWVEPVPEDFAYGTALAFDQTLTKTGWAVVVNNDFGLQVSAGGRLMPEPPEDLTGFEQTFAKAERMGLLIQRTLSLQRTQMVDVVVHEMPAVRGHRIESSLMAAREVRRSASQYGRPVAMVSRQHAYAVLVGHPHGDKAEGTARVNALVPAHRRNTRAWNQDVHDAVLLGLQWLHDKKQRDAS